MPLRDRELIATPPMAGLRARLNREQGASELLSEAGALIEDAVDQKQRSMHLAGLAVPTLGDGGDPGSLKDQIAVSYGKSAEEIAERLAQAAIERHGGALRDEIAILVLHRNGAG